MKSKAALIITLLLAVMLLGTGFSKAVVQKKDKFDMKAKITKVVYENNKMTSVMVDNLEHKKGSYDKAVMLINENTKIIKGNKNITDLKEGQKVEITFVKGPITMMYPPRIGAKVIKVIE